MAFTSIGYDGSVNERQWAELVPSAGSSTYGVKGAGDLKVTAVPGQPLMVSVAAGTAWGHGVMDTETANTTITCDAISSGTRWDLIALRRDWQPLAGGPTSAVKITGTAEKVIPGSRQVQPGVVDDQPLALVQWTAGQTQPTQIIDLRCWAGNGGLVANDTLALSYLGKLGASVTIAGSEWNHVVGANDSPAWVKSTELGKIPLFGFANPVSGTGLTSATDMLIQAGAVIQTTTSDGYARLYWPKPFPNGLLNVIPAIGDEYASGSGTVVSGAGNAAQWGPPGTGTRTEWVYSLSNTNGRLGNKPHRVNWIAIGW
jgi:hypothetical protein